MTIACIAGGALFFILGSAAYALSGFLILMWSLRGRTRSRRPS